VTAKIVYYGPGLSGKTTNLQYIFSVTNPQTRGELVSIETDVERTLFFDLLPINVGLVNGYQTKFQLYTVPGQIFYDSTRQLVLKGADGIVFVADSQELMEPANLESLENLKTNLSIHNQNLSEMPLVFQFNKRDLKNTSTIERLNEKLNTFHCPYFGATATRGTGVIETLREISTLTLKKIKDLMDQDQSMQTENQKTIVDFDMNRKHKIIKREELPLKKITGADFGDSNNKDKAVPQLNKTKMFSENEDVFELEGFEEIEEVEELKGFEDIPEAEELKGFEEIEKVEELKEFETMPEIPEIEELTEFEKIREPGRTKEADKAKEKEVKEKPLNLAPELEPKPESKPEPEPGKKEPKKPKLDALDLLNKFKDASRVTVIKKMKKLPGKDSPVIIEVKDNDSSLLEPIEIKITPDTKKITIILDVKK
jgi:signal recognition particle receptor subunit beta